MELIRAQVIVHPKHEKSLQVAHTAQQKVHESPDLLRDPKNQPFHVQVLLAITDQVVPLELPDPVQAQEVRLQPGQFHEDPAVQVVPRSQAAARVIPGAVKRFSE